MDAHVRQTSPRPPEKILRKGCGHLFLSAKRVGTDFAAFSTHFAAFVETNGFHTSPKPLLQHKVARRLAGQSRHLTYRKPKVHIRAMNPNRGFVVSLMTA